MQGSKPHRGRPAVARAGIHPETLKFSNHLCTNLHSGRAQGCHTSKHPLLLTAASSVGTGPPAALASLVRPLARLLARLAPRLMGLRCARAGDANSLGSAAGSKPAPGLSGACPAHAGACPPGSGAGHGSDGGGGESARSTCAGEDASQAVCWPALGLSDLRAAHAGDACPPGSGAGHGSDGGGGVGARSTCGGEDTSQPACWPALGLSDVRAAHAGDACSPGSGAGHGSDGGGGDGACSTCGGEAASQAACMRPTHVSWRQCIRYAGYAALHVSTGLEEGDGITRDVHAWCHTCM